MFKELDINLLEHHPKNPRLEMDIEKTKELSESIRVKGVLQNLTVVPNNNGKYFVVIGNRRLEAAKLAGLQVVPCYISNMSEKDCVETMLIENMNREDLTPYEEAKGVQMMFDLGSTIQDICEKTGFSESTIRHRAKMLELNQDKLKEKCEKDNGAFTLMDVYKLESITDESEREKCLDALGTREFESTIANAKYKCKLQSKFDFLKAYLESKTNTEEIVLGEFENDWNVCRERGLKDLGNFYASNRDFEEDIRNKVEDAAKEGVKILYFINKNEYSGSSYIKLCRKYTEIENAEQTATKELQKKREEIYKKIDEAFDSYAENTAARVKDFLVNLKDTTLTEASAMLTKVAIKHIVLDAPRYYNLNFDFADISRCYLNISDDTDFDEKSFVEAHPLRSIAYYMCWKDSVGAWKTSDFNREYSTSKAEELEKRYQILEALGYVRTEEDIAICNGTHRLYQEAEATKRN